MQNKIHWAAHGNTAAEIICKRADSSKKHMGLTWWPGKGLTKADAEIAKDYLNEEELGTLNRLVSMYLDFIDIC